MGRRTTYTEELGDLICELLIEADYGLEHICQQNADLPSARTVFRWLADSNSNYDSFRQQYARAKEVQAIVMADRGLKEALTATDAPLGRLKWDARRWHASKLAPKVYGDKVHQEVTGKDGGPIQTETTVDVSNATSDQLRALASLPVKGK